MVLALGINNAKNALKSQQAVSKLTNEMLVKNSETLKQGSIDIAEESEKAIVNIETIKKTNQELKTMSSDLKVKYVDLYSALLEKNHLKKDYTEDGVSLNADGYKKIWSVLRDIVEEEK
jgi:lysophospholipase L1-like esterase